MLEAIVRTDGRGLWCLAGNQTRLTANFLSTTLNVLWSSLLSHIHLLLDSLVRILTQQQETGLIVFNGSHTCDKYTSINYDV